MNVCVHDDGKGFQPDELSKAVKPYYHGESVGTEHYGMGLYICKMLCEKHGGFLRVYNSPGGGACVEFNIAHESGNSGRFKKITAIVFL